ncbi:hypothetical protein BW727_100318 [Jeotgalibaca dankookensis]|uniref:Glyoxal reductase n=1 Tax=Jeotgalibaca dankookensis TaxID=708126 RepID=A0A1S6IMI6_9LACT|nr:hypothetical protein BW727_100318 [Jeotgalibaca dankookensis]
MIPTKTLANGLEIPQVGLGLFLMTDVDESRVCYQTCRRSGLSPL